MPVIYEEIRLVYLQFSFSVLLKTLIVDHM